jgi:ribosomal protein S18 acetylase RimI-like enzyme
MSAASPPRLAPFPPPRPGGMRIPGPLALRGLSLRALHGGDLRWLRDLFATTRIEELAAVPWPDSARAAFIDQQFALQHGHFVRHYAAADFLAIALQGRGPVGRYYIQREAPSHLVVDICLLPGLRGAGVGSALLRHSQAEAAALGRGMQLHVARWNPAARRLYERLGFIVTDDSGASHLEMCWTPPGAAARTL